MIRTKKVTFGQEFKHVKNLTNWHLTKTIQKTSMQDKLEKFETTKLSKITYLKITAEINFNLMYYVVLKLFHTATQTK